MRTIVAVLGLLSLVASILVAGYFLFQHVRGLTAFRPRGLDQHGYKAERNRLRVEIASTRANVWALLILSVVGIAQFGLEIWRQSFSELSYTPAIEDILRERLPNREVMERQHREMIQTIRESRPSATTGQPDDSMQARLSELQSRVFQLEQKPESRTEVVQVMRSSIPSATPLVLLLLLGLPALGWISLPLLKAYTSIRQESYRVATRVATASLAVGSLWGGVTLLKDVTIVKNMEFNIGSQPAARTAAGPQSLDIQLNVDFRTGDLPAAAMDCGDGDSRRIGPFEEGTVNLGAGEQEKLETMAKTLAGELSSSRLTAIMLIGSADRRPLKPKTAKRYSSNEGLAQARIKAVRAVLEPVVRKERISILESFAGPSNTDPALSINDLASDRVVQVCFFWSSKP